MPFSYYHFLGTEDSIGTGAHSRCLLKFADRGNDPGIKAGIKSYQIKSNQISRILLLCTLATACFYHTICWIVFCLFSIYKIASTCSKFKQCLISILYLGSIIEASNCGLPKYIINGNTASKIVEFWTENDSFFWHLKSFCFSKKLIYSQDKSYFFSKINYLCFFPLILGKLIGKGKNMLSMELSPFKLYFH